MTNDRSNERPLLEVVDLVQEFPNRWRGQGRTLRAVSHVSFEIRKGETLGIVGQTGSGKTTLGRAVLQIPRPTSGSVLFRGVDLTRLAGSRLREHRRQIQMVFQDPFASVDSKWRVLDIVEEPLIGHGVRGAAARRRVEDVLDLVALPAQKFGQRRPGELSGGQCQRVAIARALVGRPDLIVCDEAVSSLDALIQSQILDLFESVRRELSLSYLFISHDLAVIKRISDRVAVMHFGRICEIGSTRALFRTPRHPYTVALLNSVPGEAETRQGTSTIVSAPAPAMNDTGGCHFRARCPSAQGLCAREEPLLRQVGDDQFIACHFPVPVHAEVV